MKTAIICTMWLNGEYIDKTHKFLDYYLSENVQQELGNPDIWMIDNASHPFAVGKLQMQYRPFNNFNIKLYHKHYTRTAHLEYPYCWRALYFARELFQEFDYDKVIFLNNDSFILSKKMMNFVRDLDHPQTYWTPYCKKHQFPECEIQVIMKTSDHYWNLTTKPYLSHNGVTMESKMPSISSPIRDMFKGDRHSEYGLTEIPEDADYSTQVRLAMKVRYRE